MNRTSSTWIQGLALSVLALSLSGAASGQGIVFLSGDDADDGGHCHGDGCGGLYPAVFSYAVNNSRSPGTGILAVGVNGGNAEIALRSWNEPANGGPDAPLTILTDPGEIRSVRLTEYDVLYVPSVEYQTPWGGITEPQLDALNVRKDEVVHFVNARGGALIALTEAGVSNGYGWLPLAIVSQDEEYGGVCPTPDLLPLSPGSTCINMSHCCYHTVFTGPPGFLGLKVLADAFVFPVTRAVLLGGIEVTIAGQLRLEPPSAIVPVGGTHTVTASAIEGNEPFAPIQGVVVWFEVTSGPNRGKSERRVAGSDGKASFTYTAGGGAGVDEIRASMVDPRTQDLVESNPVEVEWQELDGFRRGSLLGNVAPAEADASSLLALLLQEAAVQARDCRGEPDPDIADANDNEHLTIADYLLLRAAVERGVGIPAPSASCGSDPDDDPRGFDRVDGRFRVTTGELIQERAIKPGPYPDPLPSGFCPTEREEILLPLHVQTPEPVTGITVILEYDSSVLTPMDGDSVLETRFPAKRVLQGDGKLVITVWAERDGAVLFGAYGAFEPLGMLRFRLTPCAVFPPMRWLPEARIGSVTYRATVVDASFNDHHPALEVGLYEYVRGNSNNDQFVDISDPIHTLQWLFSSGDEPNCLAAADANNDSAVDISDPIYTLSFLFGRGRPIPQPYPDCGLDPDGVIDGLGCRPGSCPEDPPPALVGYWRLNGDGADLAGGNRLTPVGDVSFIPGKLNQAASIGVTPSSTLEAAGRSAYDISASGFTAECWVKVHSLVGANPRILRVGPARHAEKEVWELFICKDSCTPGKVGFAVNHLGASAADLRSNGTVTDEKWHHVAVTYDGSVLNLYLDGKLDTSVSRTGIQANVGSGTMTLGRNIDPSDQLDGQIDEVRIWRRALTDAEIRDRMDTEL